jgi:hypothetical protein
VCGGGGGLGFDFVAVNFAAVKIEKFCGNNYIQILLLLLNPRFSEFENSENFLK